MPTLKKKEVERSDSEGERQKTRRKGVREIRGREVKKKRMSQRETKEGFLLKTKPPDDKKDFPHHESSKKKKKSEKKLTSNVEGDRGERFMNGPRKDSLGLPWEKGGKKKKNDPY